MELPSRLAVHAGHRDGPGGRHDPRLARPRRRGRRAAGAGLTLLAALAALAGWAAGGAAAAGTLRLATWSPDLTRAGPGILLRDIARDDPQIAAAVAVIAAARPDVLLLTGFDHDLDGVALAAFAARLAAAGAEYPTRIALPGNRGLRAGTDLDGDGLDRGPGDAQGWGRFAGAGGMALLSRLPAAGPPTDFAAFLWRDLPGALDPAGVLPQGAAAVVRLHASGAFALPLALPGGGVLTVLAFHATPPVFDGPEDRNGRRNHDEAAFWLRLLDGALPWPAPAGPLALMGNANLDPADGEGRRGALAALLAHPALQDAAPASPGGAAAAAAQGGANARHRGDPARDTADFRDSPGPGNLRVDYVLPSAAFAVSGAGVLWPLPGDPLAGAVQAASRQRLVWVDVRLP